ncbi:MAG TPA: hypothetical protein VFM10_09730, partial [Terriglobales bacterium]|nr:hypothetical protein [Terriglobales bacterium]
MRLTIDNADGRGALDYTDALDAKRAPLVKRKLNRPSHLTMALVASSPKFAVPAARARVVLERCDGGKLFTGYIIAVPDYEYLGWGERGPVYRYIVNASSDEFLLDTRILPKRAPFVHCTAGDILKQLAVDLLPGTFDMAGVEPGATLPSYTGSVAQTWSEHAAQIALLTRGAYRVHDGTLSFGGVGKQSYVLDEAAADFCPEGLTLHSPGAVINDVTVIGRLEPGTYVKDYFLGDGMTLAYYLADRPFARRTVVVDEEYAGTGLNPRYWVVSDPAHVVAVSGGKLTVSGGNNADGATTVTFVEP